MLSLDKTLATGIGSLPYQDKHEAINFVLSCFKDDIIFWPQLPKKSFLEHMVPQFSEKLPGAVIDVKQKKISVDTKREDFSQELEACFQHYLDEDLDYFAISYEYASGLYGLLDVLGQNLASVARTEEFRQRIIKGQIVGPITFGMMLLTEENQPAIYHPELKEALIKLLSMKARWQIKKLQVKPVLQQGLRRNKLQVEEPKVIIFIDEPYLASFGSSFFTLKREDVINCLNEIIEAIHSQGAACGIHCCANTDWSVILSTNLDILSFDAYGYLDNLLLYAKELDNFLDKGGILSLGIVPNNEEAEKRGKKAELVARIKEVVKNRSNINKMLITPSCGCGTLDVRLSEEINHLCREVAKELS